ncbi:TctA family transporter [Rhizobium sp. BK313]|nr:TctA family transporter [Rhizobium sp. BK313]
MWTSNLMLVVLNLPLIGLWVKLLTIPYYLLFPIMAFCSIGVYSVNSNVYDLYAVAFFGFAGSRRSLPEMRPVVPAAPDNQHPL